MQEGEKGGFPLPNSATAQETRLLASGRLPVTTCLSLATDQYYLGKSIYCLQST